jgi:hypothetical protein
MSSYTPPALSAADPPKLLDRVRDRIRRLGYAKRTEQSYVQWIKRLILFHGKRYPAEMSKKGQVSRSRICSTYQRLQPAVNRPFNLLMHNGSNGR